MCGVVTKQLQNPNREKKQVYFSDTFGLTITIFVTKIRMLYFFIPP